MYIRMLFSPMVNMCSNAEYFHVFFGIVFLGIIWQENLLKVTSLKFCNLVFISQKPIP